MGCHSAGTRSLSKIGCNYEIDLQDIHATNDPCPSAVSLQAERRKQSDKIYTCTRILHDIHVISQHDISLHGTAFF